MSVTLDGLLREILARDARDANREVAPLRPAADAVRIDTTGQDIAAVVERVLALVPGRAACVPQQTAPRGGHAARIIPFQPALTARRNPAHADNGWTVAIVPRRFPVCFINRVTFQ